MRSDYEFARFIDFTLLLPTSTEAQIREQNARIALLERQAAAQTGTDGACITVTFEGVDGC